MGPVDRFIPGARVHGRRSVRVRAPAELVFEVAEGFDLFSLAAVRCIFHLRAWLLRAPRPRRGDLDGLAVALGRLGWGELHREPGRALAMGALVQPWLPEPVFRSAPPEAFAAEHLPGHVKIVWSLEVEPLGPERARLATETRVLPLDEEAAKKFQRYWRFAGLGIELLRPLLLRGIRRTAERRYRRARRSSYG